MSDKPKVNAVETLREITERWKLNRDGARPSVTLGLLRLLLSRLDADAARIAELEGQLAEVTVTNLRAEAKAKGDDAAIKTLQAELAEVGVEAHQMRAERDAARAEAGNWLRLHDQQDERADAAEARLAKAVEALTPSAATKAAYIGEFSFTVDDLGVDDDGDTFETQREITVPWTTVKEIMAAIRAHATLSELEVK